MRKCLFFLLILLIFISCSKLFKKTSNIFMDETLQQIYTFQDERNTTELIKFFNNENITYRKAAVMAFASVQDSVAIEPLKIPLTDKNLDIRLAAAYALGQIKHTSAEPILIEAYKNEQSQQVKCDILEAIGKCGTETGLSFILEIIVSQEEELLCTGQIC